MSGEFIRTWVHPIDLKPYGLCIDPIGGVLVCDYENGQVLRIHPDRLEKEHQVLLDQDKLGNKRPYSVSISQDGRLLIVGVCTTMLDDYTRLREYEATSGEVNYIS